MYQMLRIFNMLTKSKISEARCSDVENIVTMLSNEVAIHIIFVMNISKQNRQLYRFSGFVNGGLTVNSTAVLYPPAKREDLAL